MIQQIRTVRLEISILWSMEKLKLMKDFRSLIILLPMMQRIVEVIYSVPEVLVILLLSAMLGEAMKAYASSGGFGADLVSKMGANLISMFMAFGMLYWVGMIRIIRGQV